MSEPPKKVPDTVMPLPGTTVSLPERRVTVDVDAYSAYLDGTDFTDEEKAAFLQAMWEIVVAFVELGFGVHPTQQVDNSGSTRADLVQSKPQNNQQSSQETICGIPAEECEDS